MQILGSITFEDADRSLYAARLVELPVLCGVVRRCFRYSCLRACWPLKFVANAYVGDETGFVI
jgi:hypothetical protein